METTNILSKESMETIDQLEAFETMFRDKVLELFKIFEMCRKIGIFKNKPIVPSLMFCLSDNFFCDNVWQIGSYIINYGFNKNCKHPWHLSICKIKHVYKKRFMFKQIPRIVTEPFLSASCKLKDREDIQKGLCIEYLTPFHDVDIDDFYSLIITLKIEIEELIKLRKIESSNKMEKLGGTFETIKQIENDLSTVV